MPTKAKNRIILVAAYTFGWLSVEFAPDRRYRLTFGFAETGITYTDWFPAPRVNGNSEQHILRIVNYNIAKYEKLYNIKPGD